MKRNIIKCLNCRKTFRDDTKTSIQNSETNNFKNMCPFCYGTNTRNTHKETSRKAKFIYHEKQSTVRSKKKMKCWHCGLNGKNILDKYGCCLRCETNLKKYPTKSSHPYPNLSDEAVAKEVLGVRTRIAPKKDVFQAQRTQPMTETTIEKAQGNSREFIIGCIGIPDSSHFSSIDLANREYKKILENHKKLLLPPNNRIKYEKWRHGYGIQV